MHILIVQRVNDRVFVYREDLRHHAVVQGNAEENDRLTENYVAFDVFDTECDALHALENGQWTSTIVP